MAPAVDERVPETKRKAFALLMESLTALRRENKDVLWSSMIKDTMKRKKPSFNESYHGYRSFSDLLEDAKKEGLLDLETDKRSRTYVVTRFGSEMSAPDDSETAPARKKLRRRRSGSRRKAPETGTTAVAEERAAVQPAASPAGAAAMDEALLFFPPPSSDSPDVER
jgi:hypothetical protein